MKGKRIIKNLALMIVCLLVVIGVGSNFDSSADSKLLYWVPGTEYGFEYRIDGDYVTILNPASEVNSDGSAKKSKIKDEIRIPSAIDGKTVKNISSIAFSSSTICDWAIDDSEEGLNKNQYFKKNEVTVYIPDTIENIQNNAFNGQTKFKFKTYGSDIISEDNVLTKNIKTVGEKAFYGCSLLKGSLVVPSSVTSIGDSAFEKTALDGDIEFESGSLGLVVGNNAFSGLNKVQNLYFTREGVTRIGDGAFKGMSALKCGGIDAGGNPYSLFMIPCPNLTYIGKDAFNGDSKLYAYLDFANIPNITTLGEGAFFKCSSLIMPEDTNSSYGYKMRFPNGIDTINDSTFTDCSGLYGEVDFNNVTSIGKDAFKGCILLRGDLDLSKVTKLGSGAFYMEKAYIVGADGKTSSEFAINDIKTVPQYIDKKRDNEITGNVDLMSGFDGTLTLANGLEEIPDNCFNGLVDLSGGLTIPSSVTVINSAAFADCISLSGKLTIPDTVLAVGSDAFRDMIGMTSLSISNSLTKLDAGVFKNCYNLNCELVIPSGVTSIGKETFYGCRSLKGTLKIPCVEKLDDKGKLSFESGVTSIGEAAFQYCRSFTGDLIVPNSVTTIGKNCFYDCTGIDKDLYISSRLANIPYGAFGKMENVEKNSSDGGYVIVPNEGKNFTIGELAFYHCLNIKKIRMERNVTSIHIDAFGSTDDRLLNLQYEIYKVNSGARTFVEKAYPDDWEDRIIEIPDVDGIKVYLTDSLGNKTGDPVLSSDKIVIPYGKTIKLYAESYIGGKPSGFDVKYESLNDGLLNVNKTTGQVSVKSKTASGEATIRVSDANGGDYYCDVIFSILDSNQAITGFKILDKDGKNAANAFDLLVGDSVSLTVSDIAPTDVKAEYQNISWSTSDSSAVSITKNSANGHSVSLGGVKYATKVTVIAEADYGSGSATKKTFTINVYPKADITSVVNVSDGIQISWPFIDGAAGYEVYRKINGVDSTAKKVAGTKKDVNSVVDTTIASNPEYIGKTVVYYVVAVGAGKDNKSKELSIKYANNNFTVGNTKYIMNSDGTVTYAGSSAKAASVTIPQTVKIGKNDAKVKAIAANAFAGDTTLTTVVIPNSVKTIGANAFKNCKNLKTVTMGTGVTSIGANAFTNCKALTSIVIPKKVKTIGKAAFSGCSKLKTVTFKTTKLTKVGSKAFKTIKKGATFKIKKSKFSKYKKLIKKSGVPKKAKYKKTK